jgi:hypothetical protein
MTYHVEFALLALFVQYWIPTPSKLDMFASLPRRRDLQDFSQSEWAVSTFQNSVAEDQAKRIGVGA